MVKVLLIIKMHALIIKFLMRPTLNGDLVRLQASKGGSNIRFNILFICFNTSSS